MVLRKRLLYNINMSKWIGIVGSRNRDSQKDFTQCERIFLSIWNEGDYIVSGGCPRGGDRFAEVIAKKYGIPIMIYYPNWNKYGKSAGFKRNGLISHRADVLIAVVREDRQGGTEDTIRKAENDNKSIIVVGNE